MTVPALDSEPMMIPVIGVLSRLSRSFLLGTVGLSLVTIVLGWGVHADPTLLFVVSGTAILGLAWVIGLSTERLGAISGPHVGGVLNATFGNIAELIISFFALREGLVEVVKASLTGSIIGNLLLVLGISVLVGGLHNGTQRFNAKIASANAALLVVALIGFFVPAVFAMSAGSSTTAAGAAEQAPHSSIIEESVLVAVLLIIGYVLAMIYQFRHAKETLGAHESTAGHGGPAWSGKTAIGVLLVAAALLAALSEILVASINPFIATFGLSAMFVGVVLIPTIGNLAEHLVSVQLAWKNKMEFSMAVSYGSSLQVALFVGPALVILGAIMGQPMNLVFHPLEVAAVAAAVAISALIALDGESNWLEGALLAIVYVILAVSFLEVR